MATTAGGVSSAGFAAADGWSATAADFSATEGSDFSVAEGADLSAADGAGLGGGGLRKESTKAHPPAIQTAIMKTTPAVRTAFWSVVRRGGEDVLLCRSTAGLSGSVRLSAGGDTSPAIRSEMLCPPPKLHPAKGRYRAEVTLHIAFKLLGHEACKSNASWTTGRK